MKKKLLVITTAIAVSLLASCGGATEGSHTQAQLDSITKFQTDSIAKSQKAILDSVANVEAQRLADSTRTADSLAQLSPTAAPTRTGSAKPEHKPATVITTAPTQTTTATAPTGSIKATSSATAVGQKSTKIEATGTVELKNGGAIKAQPEKK